MANIQQSQVRSDNHLLGFTLVESASIKHTKQHNITNICFYDVSTLSYPKIVKDFIRSYIYEQFVYSSLILKPLLYKAF